jgi:hypothetical protein
MTDARRRWGEAEAAGARGRCAERTAGRLQTHLARALAAQHSFVQLDGDRLRRSPFKRPSYSQVGVPGLRRHKPMDRLLAAAFRICDATNLKEAYRRPLYEIAEKHGRSSSSCEGDGASVVESASPAPGGNRGWDESGPGTISTTG